MKLDASYQREAIVSGSFYPETTDQLQQSIAQCLAAHAQHQHANQDVPKALIVPYAGLEFSGKVAAAGYVQLQPVASKIKRVVLIGFGGSEQNRIKIAASNASAFVTPFGEVPVDSSYIQTLIRIFPVVEVDDDLHQQEHCLEMQLPFLQSVLDDFTIVPLIVSEHVEHEEFVECLNLLWGGDETLIIVSSNLSLNQNYATGQNLDKSINDSILQLQPETITRINASADIAIKGLLSLGKFVKLSVKALDIGNSGDAGGVKDSVVGYGCYGFYAQKNVFSSQLRQQLSGTARMSIEYALRTGEPWEPNVDGYQALLVKPRGCFVTLFDKNGERRGSAGTVETEQPLLQCLCENAFNAAFNDPLFTPLSLQEWSDIHLNIAIVDKFEPVLGETEQQVLDQLTPYVDGVIIKQGEQGMAFLPIDWHQFPNKQTFFSQLKQRAGIEDNQQSITYEVFRYTTESWR